MVYLLRCDPPCLFSGDHIFVGGLGQCGGVPGDGGSGDHGFGAVVMTGSLVLLGRLFEGNADTMLQSINAIKAMDERTLMFPGEGIWDHCHEKGPDATSQWPSNGNIIACIEIYG